MHILNSKPEKSKASNAFPCSILELRILTCYFRHLEQTFKRAGIEVTRENKREIDKVIHNVVETRYKNFPHAWKEVKKRIAEDEDGFIAEIKKELTKRP
jgi:molecular chaperone GrpE (heat shock protein)